MKKLSALQVEALRDVQLFLTRHISRRNRFRTVDSLVWRGLLKEDGNLTKKGEEVLAAL